MLLDTDGTRERREFSMRLILLLLGLSSAFAPAQQTLTSTAVSTTTTPQLGPTAMWSRSFTELTVTTQPVASAIALAANGHCVAIAGARRAEVLDIAGHPLWTWDFGRVNKFITAGGLAVSPNCDAIAMVGDSGYKYTWIADRHRRKTSIPTTSTPLGIAFSHDGQLVAVGTGGCDLLLISKSGDLKWKRVLHEGYCTVGKLSFTSDDQFIMLQGSSTGLVRLDGTPVWMASGWGMGAARDLQTFVSWWVPNHGPSTGSITVLNGTGKELWHRVAPGNSAAISASGGKIAAPVYEKQDLTREEWENVEEQPVNLQVFSRSGELLKSFPFAHAEVIAISPDGNRLLARVSESTQEGVEVSIEELNSEGKPILRIPDRQMGTVLVPDDFSGLLVLSRSPALQLQWFKLK